LSVSALANHLTEEHHIPLSKFHAENGTVALIAPKECAMQKVETEWLLEHKSHTFLARMAPSPSLQGCVLVTLHHLSLGPGPKVKFTVELGGFSHADVARSYRMFNPAEYDLVVPAAQLWKEERLGDDDGELVIAARTTWSFEV
jgi:hypothetical protein